MASIEYRPRVTRVTAYVDKEPYKFPLGRVSKKVAERFASNIDALLHERRCNVPHSREVSNWLAGLDDTIYGLLAERRLVQPRRKAGCTIGGFVDSYIEGRSDVTERRLGKFRCAKRRLVEYFGDIDMQCVTAGDAEEYARWLLKQLAPATAMKECTIAAQFFRHAFRKELIAWNPFEGVTVGKASNESRRVYVPADVVEQVIDACPDWQWRTVVALARFGGVRVPSEVAPLTWSDILWDQNKMTVTSPKTARYGKASRVVPIFPRLRPYLDNAFTLAEEGERWVVPMLRGRADKNLGTRFRKIIKRAGVEVWPKPFQNLRASCQTDLDKNHKTFVVCAWLGNTPRVAHQNYLTVTEEDFPAAVEPAETGAQLRMQRPAPTVPESQKESASPVELRENAPFSDVVGLLDTPRVAAQGLEPRTRGL